MTRLLSTAHRDSDDERDEFVSLSDRPVISQGDKTRRAGVYVIGPVTGGGPVKIGRTDIGPLKRLAEMQTGSPWPLGLVAFFPSTSVRTDRMETHFHGMFYAERRHGEWFVWTAGMRDWLVASTCAAGDLWDLYVGDYACSCAGRGNCQRMKDVGAARRWAL
jgi:hypothetical protein